MSDTDARRRMRNWVLIAVVLVVIVLARMTSMPERLPTPFFDLPKPMVVAQQGGHLVRPGNTVLAFDHALALGVDALQVDLRLSKDGQVVAIHDPTVARTTDGVGEVRELELAELQTLDAGYRWPFGDTRPPYRGQGVRIPTLDGLLRRYPDQRLLLELKDEGEALAGAVCELLEERRRGARVLVGSSYQRALDSFRRTCPQVATGASTQEAASFLFYYNFGFLRFFTAPALSLVLDGREQGLMNAELVRSANDLQLQVIYTGLADVASMRAAVQAGAMGIVTPRPEVLMDELGRR